MAMHATKSTARLKHCPDCGFSQPLAVFARNPSARDGLQNYCRDHQYDRQHRGRFEAAHAGIEARTAAIRAEKQGRGEGPRPKRWSVPTVHVLLR